MLHQLKIYSIFLGGILAICASCTDNSMPNNGQSIMVATMGASLMSPSNGWVEQACKKQGVQCLNKAVNGTTTIHYAQMLWQNNYATEKELNNIDILLIQFANCKDVYGDSTTFFSTAEEYARTYTEPSDDMFSEYSCAQQMDYILKKWQEICKQYKRPMHVIFVTHWHDGRVVYNESVRKLAKRWNAEVCELDKYIGFTKDKPLPDGTQPSIQYAKDTEVIDGVVFGWHPKRGNEGEYIQSAMANILHAKLEEYLHH